MGRISQAQRQEVSDNWPPDRWRKGTSALLSKTPLYDWHKAHGGKLVDFAGWSLPVSYGDGLIAEHLATRKHGGLFDISHMGRFMVRGPGARAWLSYVLTNDPAKLAPGRAQYTLISNSAGHPLDDAYLYQQEAEQYLLVVNAANLQKDWDWLEQHLGQDVDLEDVSLRLAMLALQGPDSEKLLSLFSTESLPAPGRNNGGFNRIDEVELYVSRTGYTGEPLGFELFLPWDAAQTIWAKLVREGQRLGVVPVGLGARDTLRLEACLPLYGHEYRPNLPIMTMPTARWGVDLNAERDDFVGRRALETQAGDLAQRVYAVAALTKGMMREGSPILMRGKEAGVMTSATTIPAWRFEGDLPGDESYVRPLGLALLESSAQPDDRVEIVYRKRVLPGMVVQAFVQTKGNYLKPIEFDGGAI